MTPKKLRNQTYFLLFIGAIALFGWLSALELRAEEPRRAVVALEMVLSGNWDSPTLNGWTYLNKPPLFNWIMALFMWISGSFSEVVVRLPSLLSFIGILVLIRHAIKNHLNDWKNAVIIVPLCVLATGEFLFLGTVNSGEIDLFFSLLVIGQVYSIFHFSQTRNWLALFVISYILAALGFLTKGLPSVLFQGITLVAWLAFSKSFKKLFTLQHIAGLLSFIVITGSVLFMYQKNGLLDDFIVKQFKESSQRFSEDQSFLKISLQMVSYPLNLMQWLLPWSILAPFWLIKQVRSSLMKKKLISFILLFTVSNLPVYWISAFPKSRYVFMFLPLLSILLIAGAMEASEKKLIPDKITRLSISTHYLTVIGAVAVVSFFFIPALHLNGIYLRITVVLALLILLFILQRRWMTNPWFQVISFLLIIRIGMNLILLPYLDAYSIKHRYRQNVEEILMTTEGQSIHFYGYPEVFNDSVNVFKQPVVQSNFASAPLIPYQIPYYISRNTNEIMRFDTILEDDQWYLSEKVNIPAHQLITDSINDYWLNRSLYLFRYKG